MTKTMLEKYQSNLTAGQNILHTFTDTSSHLQVIRYAILVAQMQSGKTFTYMFVFMEMMCRMKVIDSVVIFSGNAELALKKQTQECLNNQEFEDFYKEHLVFNCGKDAEDVDDLWHGYVSKIKEQQKIQVVWGTEGAKPHASMRRTLFIWDESHFAQDKKMCPDRFLDTMGILPNGDFRRLNESDNYVLSVSATPFSEICDIQHYSQGKMVIPFVPSENYWGVKQMWESGMIVKYTNIKEQARLQMMDFDRFEGQNKIGIIRIPNSSKKEKTESYERVFTQMAAELGYEVFLYYQESEDPRRIANKQFLDLLDEPNLTRKTLILVKGHCRMGQVLKKKNISFVMETSTNSRTDVVLQGLLGRMCGYDGNPLIRVCLKATKLFEKDVIRLNDTTGMKYVDTTNEVEKYIEFTQQISTGSFPSVMPIYCRNLIADEKTKDNAKTKTEPSISTQSKAGGGSGTGEKEEKKEQLVPQPCIPVKFTRGVEDLDERYIKFKAERLKECAISLIPELYLTGENHNLEKVKEALDELVRENMELYVEKTRQGELFTKHTINDSSARRICDSIRTKMPNHLGSSNGTKEGGRQIGIYVANKDFTEYGIEEGDVFLWAVVKVPLEGKKNNDEVLLSDTSKKEVFCGKTTECGETLESNGACGMELAKETACDVVVMKTAIISRIETKMDGWIDSRKITSNNAGGTKWSGIYVSNDVYISLKRGGEIYEEVLRRFKVKLCLKKPLGRNRLIDETMKRLCEISW
jgi:hypothetical protein